MSSWEAGRSGSSRRSDSATGQGEAAPELLIERSEGGACPRTAQTGG
jgi:hypothetical protein